MTLPVSLAAAAVTLRDVDDRQPHALTSPIFAKLMHVENDHRFAVANLIDGTLGIHERMFSEDYPQIPDTCEPCGELWPCPTLQLLVPLVRAFLPDWNPDTEETP